MSARNGHWQGAGSFQQGKVGDAFSFDGTPKYIYTDNPGLNFRSDFSIELWYKDGGLAPGSYGALLAKRTLIVGDPCNFGMTIRADASARALLVYYLDPSFSSNGSFQCLTYANLPTDQTFHHLAATFHQVSLTPGAETIEAKLYVDGQPATSAILFGSIARTANNVPITIGASNSNGEWFKGLIDEVTLFSGVLSPDEVRNIFAAQAAGKCVTQTVAPTITLQPQSQTVDGWADATFTVGATGTGPLNYQWRFNGADISGAASSSYIRYTVEPAHAGAYSVYVWNSAGGATSAAATLTVSQPDVDADGLPDWWEYKYFGDLSQDGASDYDRDGVLNSQEYANGTNPNTIRFWTSLSGRTSSETASGKINVVSGVPYQMAVLADTTDLSAASWVPFASIFVTPQLRAEGPHAISVGLRGRAWDSEQTWYTTTIIRDTAPPIVVVTNPAPGTTSRPMIQLQGYSTKPLASLRYDINNANGITSDLHGLVSGRCFSTNLHDFTTNFFQCYDIDLTSGANDITLRATDVAGNTTVVNVSYTLVSDSVAPQITLGWPEDGMHICGDSFTVDGWLDDPTASVALRVDPAGGDAATYLGLVERNGHFWVENLPLTDGVTSLSIVATDPWGNSSTANLAVTRSALNLSINVDPAKLRDATTSVAGGIEAGDYSIWINGLKAENYGNGTWFRDAVPVNAGGTAGFTVKAYRTGQEGLDSAAVTIKTSVDKEYRPHRVNGFKMR